MSDELPISKMERILLEDPRVIAIHPAEQWSFPEIDYTLWEEKGRDSQKGRIGRLQNYLFGPYIEDDFGSNHPARRVWKGELERKYEWFHDYYANNALRLNRAGFLIFAMGNLRKDYVGPNPEELKNLTKKVAGNFKGAEDYDRKASEQKIELMKEVKRQVYDVLVFLSQQSPVS